MPAQPKQPAQPDNLVVEIAQYLERELAAVDRVLHDILDSQSSLVREVGEYICLAGGKKLRPMITLLAARAYNAPSPAPVQLAAAMEAVHVATLMHDDVIDKAPMRRGRPSVNARWGDDVAILMADYLYAAAFELSLNYLDHEPLRLICQVTRRMCEGEMFQIEKRGRWLEPEDYIPLITCKTACLFSACAAVGGIAGGLDPVTIARLSAFGLEFGLAFQITDDALDLTATDALWGKPVGIDMATGKQTLPLILALRQATDAERRTIESILENGGSVAAANGEMLAILERYGCIDETLETARRFARQAVAHLDGLTVYDEVAAEYMKILPDYVITRQY